MKKIVLIGLLLVLLAGAFLAFKLVGPATAFNEKTYYLLIKTGSNYNDVKATLEKDAVLTSPGFFDLLAKRVDYPGKVKAGRYAIKKGMSLLQLVRVLKNGQQEPVNLVITKLRTREDLASLAGKKFECDSASFMQFISNPDSLKQYHLDSNTVMTVVFPDTYTYFWNSTPSRIFSKLYGNYQAYWTTERLNQANALSLNPQTAYTLASIVEEETNRKDDKGKIASVYLNRMAKGMRLGADPTVKFALRQFGLKRIYEKHLLVESPYNTYRVYGLPPGPICTPSRETLDAVLHAPKTNYIYFVAKASLDGYSNFADNYTDHLKYAKEYQQALNKLMEQKQAATGQ